MRSHSNKACWNQQGNERLKPFSYSRQMTPIQNPEQQRQIYNDGEQRSKQNMTLTTRAKYQVDRKRIPWYKLTPGKQACKKKMLHNIKFIITKMLNRDQTNRAETILQQRARSILHQKKTMKTQAVQVNETNKDERQINGGGDHPRTVEEECL